MTESSDWQFRCPSCSHYSVRLDSQHGRCSNCAREVEHIHGVARIIAADRLARFQPFLETYQRVRVAEGRGTLDDNLLRALPACPKHHPLAHQWQIRERSFAALMTLLKRTLVDGARVVDLGAGTGWLSYRLAEAGFQPCAIDLRDEQEDGLGAASAFDGQWPRIQAELDNLPIDDDVVDAVIFNASFHYLEHQRDGLAEALRVTKPGGLVVIADTPIYNDDASGEAMLEEQQTYFQDLIGQRSDAISTSGYLSRARLAALSEALNLRWQKKTPYYGLRWLLRPLRARLRGQREPGKFAIVWAYKSTTA